MKGPPIQTISALPKILRAINKITVAIWTRMMGYHREADLVARRCWVLTQENDMRPNEWNLGYKRSYRNRRENLEES